DLNSLVSFVDKGAERILVKELSKILPEAGFLTEEDTVEYALRPYMWIVDPLDGTTNSLLGIPHFAVSVALAHEGELLIGVVHEVNSEEQFYASKSGGAFLNGRPIQVSQRTEYRDILIATGFPYRNEYDTDKLFACLKELLMNTRGVRRMGSAALDLAYVACGRFGAYYESMLNPWDVAAGILIVREAGGKVSDYNGVEKGYSGKETMAAAPQFYDIVKKVLNR
ncbi:inositol monophosphatase, partial [Saprospiraceae bacterium]|nr:inositol monophosphatase [Saprospiraceae bacterium]